MQNRTLLHSGRSTMAYEEYGICKLYNICDKIGLTGAHYKVLRQSLQEIKILNITDLKEKSTIGSKCI